MSKFPEVHVDLEGMDGNAFIIIARTRRALRKAGATPEQLEEFSAEVESGDYDNVIQTVMRWVET